MGFDFLDGLLLGRGSASLVLLTSMLLLLLTTPTEAYINRVTVDNANQAMTEIAHECKVRAMDLDTCRDYAELIHPEFTTAPVGAIYLVSFNIIYRTVMMM